MPRIRADDQGCYWPNLGYGRFGPRVTMDDAPVFDAPERFEPRCLRLADIDGTGVTDLVYLAGDGVRLYFNRCGNGWSAAVRLPNFPPIDNVASVEVADVLGNGTACLVWSSPLPGASAAPMRFVDLMGGSKPHLLTEVDNHLGARTRIEYASSTRFYREAELAGRPWITRLPFPVFVVARVETTDEISRSRFTSRYTYHHGFFDGVEREFRGFGLVEQLDTEEFSALAADGALASNVDAATHVPPVLTRSWFHTGVHLGRERISRLYAERETYREPGLTDAAARAQLLEDTVLPPGLTVEEEREACRALKGSLLRQEVYALDGTDRQAHPYTVSEQNFTVRLLQPRGDRPNAVFLSHAREALTTHYERTPVDPRVAHALTLEVDDFGGVLRDASVVYGRRRPDPSLEPRDQAKQAEIHVILNERRFTNAVASADVHRAPLPAEERSLHLTGLSLPAGQGRFSFEALDAAGPAAAEIPYEAEPEPGRLQKRAIETVRTLYRRDDLSGPLPLGRAEALGLPFEACKLAFTPGLLTKVYEGRVSDTMLQDDGRYVHSEGDDRWWIPSGQVFFAPTGTSPAAELAEARQRFFLPRRYQDPFGSVTSVTYDAHALFVVQTRDALDNVVNAGIDYRVLQPRLMTDPNGNRSAVAFDALGMVVLTAVLGKADDVPRQGDLLDGPADLDEAVVLAHLADPLVDPQAILGRASARLVYDLFAFERSRGQAQPAPAVVYTVTRETHDAELGAGERTKVQHGLSYSDGFGREIQKKGQAEPGPDGAARWVGSGWTVFNNKGKPVRQFEPFFTSTHRYESDVRVGVSPVLFYDPVERVVATLHPDQTWEKVRFDPWRQESWDGSDTLLLGDPRTDPDVGEHFRRLPEGAYLPGWFAARQGGALGRDERRAALRAAVHASTPTVAHTDSLARTVLTVAHNRLQRTPSSPVEEAFFASRVELDIEGNQRAVLDANDRVIMLYDQDLLGNTIHQSSMEAGERWTLSDVAGKPIYAFDSRGHRLRSTHDPLRRPVETFLREGEGAEILIGRTVYGESLPQPEVRNQRGETVQVLDQAGLATTEDFDFKGNALVTRRQLARRTDGLVDWSAEVALEEQVFESRSRFDALNRPVEVTSPDRSVFQPRYNEASLLDAVSVRLRGAAGATPFVTGIDYDAKGQRQAIGYGNGVRTAYAYDPLTFRLRRLVTTRTDGARLQDLTYVYDSVGNITHIQDEAQQTVYFDNQVAPPSTDYVYDALYRLIRAEGREHAGQTSRPETSFDDRFRVRLPHPQDGGAMRPYIERYDYDAVGNILRVVHRAEGGSWTRSYVYAEPSLLEAGKVSNRLSRTRIGQTVERYRHDAHGNMVSMPHLSRMDWDYRDQLQASARSLDATAPETTFYVYDGAGQRARKVTEGGGNRREERIYLGGFEVFRRYESDGETVALERESLHVMDGERRIAMVETRTRGDDGSPEQVLRFQHGNHLGSAALELDEAGRVISYEEYYPYGSTSYQAGRSAAEVGLKRYRYTGMERDEETGFGYHSARYLAVWLGRWVSCDPIGIAADTDLFRYADANPLRQIDPGGLGPEDTCAPEPEICEPVLEVCEEELVCEGDWVDPEPPMSPDAGAEIPHDAGYIITYSAMTEDGQTGYWVPERTLGEVLEPFGQLLLVGSEIGLSILCPAFAAYETGLYVAEAITGRSTGLH